MNLVEFRTFLLLCAVINYAVLALWFVAFAVAHDGLYRLHSRWFKLEPKAFDAVHYAGMAVYKVLVLLLNVVPWLALWVML